MMTGTHRLAQHLHDGVLQTLAMARIRIDKALTCPGPLPRDLGEDLKQLLDQEIAALRELVRGADRPAPPQPDLHSALTAAAGHLESVTGIRCGIDDRTVPRRSWARNDLIAYRILHEALHNAAKHSGAQQIWVTLVDQQDRLVCEVRDDGHGFDPASTSPGFGMTAMYAQARDAGGELDIDSRRSGTVVTLVLPRPADLSGNPALEREYQR
jgi:signal transduction histidine kinase